MAEPSEEVSGDAMPDGWYMLSTAKTAQPIKARRGVKMVNAQHFVLRVSRAHRLKSNCAAMAGLLLMRAAAGHAALCMLGCSHCRRCVAIEMAHYHTMPRSPLLCRVPQWEGPGSIFGNWEALQLYTCADELISSRSVASAWHMLFYAVPY